MVNNLFVERAGKVMKVLKAVNMPGMDEVAIKLYCSELTYDEEKTAQAWSKVFDLVSDPAHSNKNIFQLALIFRGKLDV